MRKRCQEIPSQFVPKSSQKYLMKKQLVNTKFQWLKKYLNQQNQESYPYNKPLSRILNITPKESINSNIQKMHNRSTLDPPMREIHSNSSILRRRSKSRSNTEASDQLCMQKCKFKKSLLMGRSKSKKGPLLFEKDSHQNLTQKMKITQRIIRRSQTSNCRKSLRDKDNFKLTPWVLPEEYQQNNDFSSFA